MSVVLEGFTAMKEGCGQAADKVFDTIAKELGLHDDIQGNP